MTHTHKQTNNTGKHVFVLDHFPSAYDNWFSCIALIHFAPEFPQPDTLILIDRTEPPSSPFGLKGMRQNM